MPHLSLLRWSISISVRLGSIYDLPHLIFLRVCQLDIPGGPIFLQSFRFGRAGISNHPLCSDLSKRNLKQGASFPRSQLLNLLSDRLVLAEVLALEFGNCVDDRRYFLRTSMTFEEVSHSTDRRKSSNANSSGGIEWEVVDEPTATQGTVSHICDAQFFRGIDQAIISYIVSNAEYSAWTASILATMIQHQRGIWVRRNALRLARFGFAKRFGTALRKANILGFSCFSDFIESRNRLFERSALRTQVQ